MITGHIVKNTKGKINKVIHRHRRKVDVEYWIREMNNNPHNIRAFILLDGGINE
jgi:hypothetical protein